MFRDEIKILLNEKLLYLKSSLKKLEIRIKKYETSNDEEEKETLFAAMSKFTGEIVETTIKINTILLEERKDFASTYFDSFSKLSKHYDFDKNYLDKIARTTGLRNRISHEYDNIDEKITIRSFSKVIDLYGNYIEYVKKLIN